MDPETLVTFLFKAPPQVRMVELLGSWDNFAQAYQMHHDRRRGTGFWSGCFKFENIIFDGDRPCWSRPRAGGLKQGGVYWYYYRLDYDIEAYDDSRTCTADCPLMPGQMMNFMEVPTEIVEPPSRCRSATYPEGLTGTLADMTSMRKHTLEPSDKFAVLAPPPVSRVHGRCISDLALGGRLEGVVSTQAKSPTRQSSFSHEDHKAEDSAERTPSKRRRSSDRPGSRHSSSGEPSSAHSCRYASVFDAYDGESPATAPHPNPLSSAPVDDETRIAMRNGFKGFNFGLDSTHGEAGVPEEEASALYHHDGRYAADQASDHGVEDARFRIPSACSSEAAEHPRIYSLPENLLQTNDTHLYTPSADEPAQQFTGSDASPDQQELWSPTFSAATVSSNGGLLTPFRLSAGYSRDTTAYNNEPHALDEIANRLKRLGGVPGSNRPSPAEQAQPSQPTFTGYALPEPALGSVQSFGRMSESSAKTAQATRALSNSVLGDAGTSIVEDIFSELGYLGGSIN